MCIGKAFEEQPGILAIRPTAPTQLSAASKVYAFLICTTGTLRGQLASLTYRNDKGKHRVHHSFSQIMQGMP